MAELSLLVKVTAVLILALAAAWLGSRRSAAVRSLILACAFGLLLALPIVSLVLPTWAIEVPATYSSAPLARGPVTAVAPFAGSTAAAGAPASRARLAMPTMRSALLLLWGAGALVFLAPLVVGLVRVRRLRTHGRQWARSSVPASVHLLLHDEVRVPITCGVRRPVIALPADAPQWAESDLRRVLLHEMEHVRRRDWPVHMTARAICAFYWFHPLVWVAWRRLCLESERACDDAVLSEEDGTAYAALLVTMARRITNQDALPLLSIAGRSNLSTRIGAMLARNVDRGRVRIATVILLSAVAVAAALGIGPLQAVVRQQRTVEDPSTMRPAFESVSIRRHDPSTAGKYECCLVRYGVDGRVTARNVDLVDLIVSAYGLYRWQVVDAPQWAEGWTADETRRFDVEATAGRSAREADLRQMLRTMLAERFRLTVHRESRTQKVYELVVEPGGHKLQPPGEKEYVAGEDIWLSVDPKTMIATLSVEQMTMTQLARHLGFPMGTLIIDRTGLAGTYRVSAQWNVTPGSRQPTPVGSGARDLLHDVEIFDAFPAQLGLRFRETTGPVESLVVDRAERPKL
jgi:uncharacterized protein (TIGR03435 family)